MPPPWDKETVRLFATLPVQDEGRVKPLDTFANVKLLRFNGARECTDLSGKTITPIQWLMDCLFYPEAAKYYKIFRVDNAEVLTAMGLVFEKKRDRYSYVQLAPAREKLFQMAAQLSHAPEKRRVFLENQILNLAQNVRDFEILTEYLDFARSSFSIEGSQTLAGIFPGQTQCQLSALLEASPQILDKWTDLEKQAKANPTSEKNPDEAAFKKSLGDISDVAGRASALALFPPPPASPHDEWLTPAEMAEQAFAEKPLDAEQIGLLASLEKLVQARDDISTFEAQCQAFHDALVNLAQTRGEYGKITLEVAFYRMQLFYYSLNFFILSFILVAVSWLRPRSRILDLITPAAVAVPLGLLACGITLRCIIRGRPPVTTLYETVLFVTAVVVSMSLFMEWVNRRKIALALASILGSLGVFLAYKYEVREGADTMPSMVAVLNTNFWLATHVTTITIGYAAGLLAGAVAHIFVFGKLFGLKRADDAFYKGLSRMVYGVLCFGLLFSILGTVLGGIWANESWGRFWGWDPKENGALMIVLWMLAILHARLGGIIRDFGVNLAAILGGVIVAFSWFGVNLLGVGLHSYGFTSGAFRDLMAFYIVELIVLVLGGAAWLRDRRSRAHAG